MARLDFTPEEFDEVLQKAREIYAGIGKTYCPYFRDSVNFNAEGLAHLRRKSWNRGRERRDQFMRLRHLAHAPEILRLSYTVQGVQDAHEWEHRRRHGRWEKRLVSVTYYEFIAVLNHRRFKVIVKETPGFSHTQRIFWSIIPFWRQTLEGKRLVHDGNPAED
jgi:hypothetical protein